MNFNIEILLSISALILSILGFITNRYIDSMIYGPKCRIVVFSIECGRGLVIRIENVGSRIMNVAKVSYTTEHLQLSSKKDIRNYTTNLSSLFYDIPCDTRAESRIAEPEYLFPNSKHNMLSITFTSQSDLLNAWDIVSKITVKVEYAGIIRKHFPYKKDLKVDYDIFIDSLKTGNGNFRTLKTFSNNNQ